jgi:hypothetical protein
MRFPLSALIVAALASISSQAGEAAESPRQQSWTEKKCALYTRDWSDALQRLGSNGVSQEFVDGNLAFIKRGCTGDKVCARTPRDWQLVDALTILVVNQRMSSTFLPFGCLE